MKSSLSRYFYIGFLLLMTPLLGHPIMISDYSNRNQIIVDINNDRVPDVIFHQRRNELFQFYYKDRKKKAVRKYVLNDIYFTEFYEIKGQNWNLFRTETIQQENSEYAKKNNYLIRPQKNEKNNVHSKHSV